MVNTIITHENRSPDLFTKSSSESSPESPNSLTINKIRNLFSDNFKIYLNEQMNNCSNEEIKQALSGAKLKDRKANPLSYYDSTRHSVGFFLNLSNPYKDVDQVGFINFDVTIYKKPETGETIKLSYLSEIQIEPPFRGKGLFKLFYEPYINTLKAIDVDLGYLHVKSKETNTSSLYAKCGYQFTPETKELIQEKYGDVTAYLADSSVSFDTSDTIEMVQSFRDSTLIADFRSVKWLKSQLSGSPKGIKRPRTPMRTLSDESNIDPFLSFDLGMSPSSPKRHARATPSQSPMVSTLSSFIDLAYPPTHLSPTSERPLNFFQPSSPNGLRNSLRFSTPDSSEPDEDL